MSYPSDRPLDLAAEKAKAHAVLEACAGKPVRKLTPEWHAEQNAKRKPRFDHGLFEKRQYHTNVEDGRPLSKTDAAKLANLQERKRLLAENEALRRRARAANVSASELARRLGRARTDKSIHMWFSGEWTFRAETLKRVAEAVNQ